LQKREGGERDKEGIRQVGFCGGDFKKGKGKVKAANQGIIPPCIYIYILERKKRKGREGLIFDSDLK
jgi:hypothetical protein